MSGAINNQNAEALAAAAAAAAAAVAGNGNNDEPRVAQDLPKEVEKVAEATAAVVAPVLEKVASQAQEQAAAPEATIEAAPEAKAEPAAEVKADPPVAEAKVASPAPEEKAKVVSPAGSGSSTVSGSTSGSGSGVSSPVSPILPATVPPTPTGLSVKGDVQHTFTQFKNADGKLTWSPTSTDPSRSTPAERAAKYFTVGNLSTVLGIANEATRAAGLAGECVQRLGVAGSFFKGASTAVGIADAGVKVVEAVDRGIAFAKDGKDLGKGLAFGGAAANAAAAGVSATEKLASAGIIPISSEVNSILGGIGQGLKFVGGVFNIAEASKRLADNKFTVKGEKLGEIFKIAAAVAAIFLAIVGIIALFGVALPALLLPIAGVVVAVSALASGIVKGIVSSNKNKFAKSLLDGEPCAVAV